MDKDLITAIAQVGYPVVVATYVLVRLDKSLSALTSKVDELISEIREQKWR